MTITSLHLLSYQPHAHQAAGAQRSTTAAKQTHVGV